MNKKFYSWTFWDRHPNQIDPKTLKIGDKIHICFCDTSATCVYSQDGIVKQDKDGELYILNGIREDYLKNIDGCYTYLENE